MITLKHLSASCFILIKNNMEPLIINNWNDGVAPSPHQGVGQLKLVDIDSFPGAMKANIKTISSFAYRADVTTTFTADAGTDICTATANMQSGTNSNFTYSAVTFSTTGTLPAGFSASTIYFLIWVSSTTFKVATSWVNADTPTPINITDAGTGTHTITPLSIGTINWIVESKTGSSYYFALDSNGRVWHTRGSNSFYLLTGNTLTNASGNGLCLFQNSDASKEYLFVFRNAVIDVIEVTGNTPLNTPSWTSGWQSLNTAVGTSNNHEAILGQDNIIYYTDGRYIGSIKENAGQVFAPGTSATYTFNSQALDIPQSEVLSCIDELGIKVVAGSQNSNKIYPWDRISDSFNAPLICPEKDIRKVKNSGNQIYILAGTKGNIYTTQGYSVTFHKKIPDYLMNNSTVVSANPVTWGGIDVRDDALLCGIAGQTTANNGVYRVYLNGKLTQDAIPSSGGANATAISGQNSFYLFGYAGGIDYHDTNLHADASYSCVFQSSLYQVGTKVAPEKYDEIEVNIAKPAANGQIRIKYRTDESSSFADFPGGAVDFSANGTDTSFRQDIGLINIESLQIQVEFDGLVEITKITLR